jgi:hypothetical protein
MAYGLASHHRRPSQHYPRIKRVSTSSVAPLLALGSSLAKTPNGIFIIARRVTENFEGLFACLPLPLPAGRIASKHTVLPGT